MAMQVACACGHTFRSDSEDGLWEKAQAHLSEAHPDMVGKVTRDDIVAQAELI